MTQEAFNRKAEDLGNVVNLGHVNHRVPDQRLATIFYVSGLGLTRDPAMMTGVDNMWVNVGESQFHLPTGAAVVGPGIVTGLVTPDLKALAQRLARARKLLDGTHFDFRETNDCVEATCPWGNHIRCHAPDEARFGPIGLGMAYVSFEVARGATKAIAHFYREVLGANANVEIGEQGERALVEVGHHQRLVFEEREHPAPDCPDHHVQIYLANFSGPYRALQKIDGVSEESNRYQYRFNKICDLETGATLLTLDHEMRSMTHPMYGRHLVNRDPTQTAAGYRAGGDFHHWAD